MFKNILVPLDGSHVGEAALPYARGLARKLGASLALVRAAHAALKPGDRAIEQARAVAAAEAYLATVAEDLRTAGFKVQTGVPFAGSPAAWIVEEVGIRHADLIVMATHDRGGPNRWLHGSVAEEVVSRVSVPVFLMRSSETVHRVEPFTAASPALIVPLDGSSLAEAALPVATDLAVAVGGHLVLVGVIPTAGQLVAGAGGAIGTYVGSDHAQLEVDARQYLDDIAAWSTARAIRAEVCVRQGKPATEIGAVARERATAVVVMATHGRTGLTRTVLGSVAGDVLHQGACPVMLIRPAELRPAEQPVGGRAINAAPA